MAANGINNIQSNNLLWSVRKIEENVFSIEGITQIDQISVYTINGKLVCSTISNPHHIDLSALQQGVYILYVKGDNKTQALRVII